MNAIGGDQRVDTRGDSLARTRPPPERRGDAALVLRELVQLVIDKNGSLADPSPCRRIEHALQPAPMDGELRVVVARIEATRLAPQFLTEPVGVDQLACTNSNPVQRVKEPKACQFLDRVREQVDADPKLANAPSLLEPRALDPGAPRAQRGREPADTPADDEHLHGLHLSSRPKRAKCPMSLRESFSSSIVLAGLFVRDRCSGWSRQGNELEATEPGLGLPVGQVGTGIVN